MANIRSAEKRIRQNEVRRARNRTDRSRMRTAVTELRNAIDAGEGDKARQLLPSTLGLIDATAQKKVVHRNVAARTKSRLVRAVAQLA